MASVDNHPVKCYSVRAVISYKRPKLFHLNSLQSLACLDGSGASNINSCEGGSHVAEGLQYCIPGGIAFDACTNGDRAGKDCGVGQKYSGTPCFIGTGVL